MSDFSLIHKKSPDRVEMIDVLRGLSICVMLIWHFVYDLASEGMVSFRVLDNPAADVVHFVFSFLFICISGVSCAFSRSNFRRAIPVCVGAALVTLCTWLYDPTYFVKFGILHFLGASILLYAALRPLLLRIPTKVQLVLWPLLGLAASPLLTLRFHVGFLWPLGVTPYGFASSDYYPLLPYFFEFLFGTALGPLIRDRRFPAWFYSFRCRPLAFIGRNTLWVYLIHQPVSVALVWLVKQVIA